VRQDKSANSRRTSEKNRGGNTDGCERTIGSAQGGNPRLIASRTVKDGGSVVRASIRRTYRH